MIGLLGPADLYERLLLVIIIRIIDLPFGGLHIITPNCPNQTKNGMFCQV